MVITSHPPQSGDLHHSAEGKREGEGERQWEGGNSGDPSSGRAKTEGHYNVITSSTTDPELPEG